MGRFIQIRRFAMMVLIALWGGVGVVAPAHAAEEDIHHATQHHDIDGMTSPGDVEDEGVVHPEHATHCHAGACHFHMMSRRAMAPTILLATSALLSAPRSDSIQQADPLGLFRPPRV